MDNLDQSERKDPPDRPAHRDHLVPSDHQDPKDLSGLSDHQDQQGPPDKWEDQVNAMLFSICIPLLLFNKPTITWVPSGFSGYIRLDTKIVF